jgi:spermidine synthase
MKGWELLDAALAPDGTDLRLMRRDNEYVMLANGRPLMSSRLHGSEEALATLGCKETRRLTRPRVLVGGLGMGYTLRAVLDVLPPVADVTVAELVRAVVRWNHEPLASLAAYPLRDPRVRVEVGDVGFTLRAHCGQFDAILLDVDNGPAAFTVGGNAALYDNGGVAAAYAALSPGGTLAIWSAWEDTKFERRLRFHGFAVEVVRVRARLKKGGPRHTIFLAHKGKSTGTERRACARVSAGLAGGENAT